jgi:hypothetical protein
MTLEATYLRAWLDGLDRMNAAPAPREEGTPMTVKAWPESVYRDRCTVCGEELKDCPDPDRHADDEWERENLHAADHARLLLIRGSDA